MYVALDMHEGDQVALKLLKMTTVAPGQQWVEARILRRLTDNHILPIRNADQDSGQAYLVTEIATGGSLDHLLQQSGACGLDVDSVVRLIRHACFGVARAHDLNLLHNDIKAGNLFLNTEGECLVGDFGLASLIPPGSTVAVPAGFTVETVAPEIAANMGHPVASVQSDVYSMGATAYTLIAARSPHDFTGATTVTDQLAVVASQVPPRLWDVAPHVPRPVQTAIERAMDPDPARRFEKITDFAAALGARRAAGRRWRRNDQHAGHQACWVGAPSGPGSPVVVCLEQGPSPKQVRVTARHTLSGNQIHRATRTGTIRKAGAMVRSAMAAVGSTECSTSSGPTLRLQRGTSPPSWEAPLQSPATLLR